MLQRLHHSLATDDNHGNSCRPAEAGAYVAVSGNPEFNPKRSASVADEFVARRLVARPDTLANSGSVPQAEAEVGRNKKPFLKRKTQRVAAKKLDWSFVKPRTVSRQSWPT